MTETPTTADRMRATLVLVATIATIAYNAFAALGLVNGVTPATISARNPSVLTPAGYAFSIWSLIYLWMLAFAVYQLLPRNLLRFRNVRTLYLLSCVLNVAWIYCWHHGQIVVCLALIIGLAIVLFLVTQKLQAAESVKDSLLTKAPFGLYFGWITCAAIINLMICLGIFGLDASNSFVGVVLIIFAAACAALVRWKLTNYLYPLAVAWALTAIAVKQSGNTAIVIAAAFGTVTCLVTAGSIVTSLKDSTSE